MNWNFLSIFKPSSPKPTDATNKMIETIDMLQKRRKTLLKQAEGRQVEAKKRMTVGDKRGALVHLKMRKILLEQAEKIDASMMNLEIQKMSIEDATVNVEVVKTMKHVSTTMKNVQKEAGVEDVHSLMSEISQDMIDVAELGDALSQSFGPTFDEDELLDELEGLTSPTLFPEVPSKNGDDRVSTPLTPSKNAARIHIELDSNDQDLIDSLLS